MNACNNCGLVLKNEKSDYEYCFPCKLEIDPVFAANYKAYKARGKMSRRKYAALNCAKDSSEEKKISTMLRKKDQRPTQIKKETLDDRVNKAKYRSKNVLQ